MLKKVYRQYPERYRAYQQISGEVEARNVQRRIDLTPEQRRESLLSETEDVATKDQIFLKENIGNADLVIGETGAQALDKANEATIRMDNLNIARDMETAEKDTKTILLSTGWQRGADGKWRYEVPDGELKITSSKNADLEDVFEDPELFKAYPELKNIGVMLGIHSSFNNSGAYTPFVDQSAQDMMDILPEIKVRATDIDNAKSVLIHEIQHAIQHIEGFAKGGEPGVIASLKIGEDAFKKIFPKLEDNFKKLEWEHQERQRQYWATESREIKEPKNR